MYYYEKIDYENDITFEKWIYKIKDYLKNGWDGEDPADFYIDIEENYPLFKKIDNWKVRAMWNIIDEIREICEETEPMYYKEQDEKLRKLMSEFGYL